MILKIDSEIQLRQLEKPDAVDIFNIINSERKHLGKWLPFVESTKEISHTASFVDVAVDASEEKFEYIFTIRKSDKFIGLIGFKCTDKINKKTEIGYWLSEKYQKQGIVTKSVRSLCGFAFNDLKLNRIEIKCATGNIPSKNIPKKLGFKLEGIERDGELLTGNIFTDLEIYSKLRGDN